MKRTALSLAIASIAGGANALTITGETVTIGGATAIQQSTFNVIVDSVCLDAGPIEGYLGDDHWAIECAIDPAVAPGAGGENWRFQKNNGGSGQGVTAVELGLGVETLLATSVCVTVGTSMTPSGQSFTEFDCNGATTGVIENLGLVVPDIGVSDVEPKMFRGALSILDPSGNPTPLPDGALLDSRSTASLPFGLVATTSLYQALQSQQFPLTSDCNPDLDPADSGADDLGSLPNSTAANSVKDEYETATSATTDSAQPVGFDASGNFIPETPDSKGYSDQPHRVGDTKACMPTIHLAEAVSLLSGAVESWTEFGTTGGSNMFADAAGKPWAPGTDSMVLCRRTQGSGTHATIAAHILKTECSSGQIFMVSAPGTFPQITFENTGSSNLGECLDDLENVGAGNEIGPLPFRAWGVGYQSAEKNPDLEEGYRFVKIDGNAPNMLDFVEGDYWIFGATTVNRNDDNTNTAGEYPNIADAEGTGNSADMDAMFEVIVDGLSDPAQLQGLNAGLNHPFGWGGFTGTSVGGVATLPTFPVDPAPGGSMPLQSITHVNPISGLQDTCFGPVAREVGTSVILNVDAVD